MTRVHTDRGICIYTCMCFTHINVGLAIKLCLFIFVFVIQHHYILTTIFWEILRRHSCFSDYLCIISGCLFSTWYNSESVTMNQANLSVYRRHIRFAWLFVCLFDEHYFLYTIHTLCIQIKFVAISIFIYFI